MRLEGMAKKRIDRLPYWRLVRDQEESWQRETEEVDRAVARRRLEDRRGAWQDRGLLEEDSSSWWWG